MAGICIEKQMLHISGNQINHFQNASSDAFAERLTKQLQREFPDACSLPEKERLPVVQQLILAARAWGFRTEQHVAIYALAGWLHGLVLEETNPEVKTLLENQSFTTDEKSLWLEEWIEKQGTRESEGYP